MCRRFCPVDWRFDGCAGLQLRCQELAGGFQLALCHQRVHRAGKNVLPEAASRTHAGQPGLHLPPPLAGQRGQRTGVLWQHHLDFLAPVPGQYGRGGTAGYGYLQRAAVHHGGHDETAVFGAVDRIAEHLPGAGCGKYVGIHCGIARGGRHQKNPVQMRRGKGVAQPGDAAFLQPPFEGGGQRSRHHPELGTGGQQALGLAGGHLAGTHQQHRFVVQIGK